MTDSAYDARLRANGRAVMLSNHIMSEVVGSYSDAEKAAIMRMLEEELSFREQNRKRRLLKRAGFPTPKTFANYDWTQARLPGGLSREEIVTCAFARCVQQARATCLPLSEDRIFTICRPPVHGAPTIRAHRTDQRHVTHLAKHENNHSLSGISTKRC